MRFTKITSMAIVVLAVAWGARAEKKIELQDIEEDNLKSEKNKQEFDTGSQVTATSGTAKDLLPLDFLKSGFLRYFESQNQNQQPRYVHQYAVNEPPEKAPQKQQQLGSAQQAMVGYLSNVPMQIYLVPQNYAGEPTEQATNIQVGASAPAGARVAAYPTAPEAQNYIEVPGYITPSGKAYINPQYTQQIAYVSYAPPTGPSIATTVPATLTPQASVAPIAYAMPLVQYQTSLMAPPHYKNYYANYAHQYQEPAAVEEVQENEVESPKYSTQTEIPYIKSPLDYTRYYGSRAPDHRHPVPELPHPSPLLLRSQPPHLAGIPKALPMYRPLKPIYSTTNLIPTFTPKPHETYGFPSKRKPTSLLDSYIPSSLQVEYLKRGYAKDPLSLYDALSNARHGHPPVTPRHFERGFLPNQMYHTAAGGITYGHYKRMAKPEKTLHKPTIV